MVRLAVFPVVFGASFVALTIAFYNFKKFYPELEETKRQKAWESHYQALEFKAKVAEGVQRERAKLKEEEKAKNSKNS